MKICFVYTMKKRSGKEIFWMRSIRIKKLPIRKRLGTAHTLAVNYPGFGYVLVLVMVLVLRGVSVLVLVLWVALAFVLAFVLAVVLAVVLVLVASASIWHPSASDLAACGSIWDHL